MLLQGGLRGRGGGRNFDADRQTVEQRRAALEGNAKWGHDRFEGGTVTRGKRDPRRATTLGTKMCAASFACATFVPVCCLNLQPLRCAYDVFVHISHLAAPPAFAGLLLGLRQRSALLIQTLQPASWLALRRTLLRPHLA